MTILEEVVVPLPMVLNRVKRYSYFVLRVEEG